MVKAIFSNPLTRKVVASTMFATAVVGANATNLKNEKSDNFINQTEVVSKEAASAMRVHVQEVRIHQFQHNEKLDKMLLKTCEKQKDVKNLKEKIDDTYNSIGTYRTSIEIQRGLDDYYVEKALNEYTEHYALSNEDRAFASEMISHFYGWKDQVYCNELYKAEVEVYKSKKVLTAQECSEMLDKHLNNTKFFTEEDKKIYNEFVGNFISKQGETSSVNSVSDLLAYKSHLLNSLAFNNYFKEYESIPNFHILVESLGHTFVNGEGVIKP